MRESGIYDELMVEAIRRIRGGGGFVADFISIVTVYRLNYIHFSSFTAVGKWRVIALTNNFSKTDSTIIDSGPPSGEKYPNFTADAELKFLGWEEGATPPKLRAMFDDFIDSSAFGMRCVVF